MKVFIFPYFEIFPIVFRLLLLKFTTSLALKPHPIYIHPISIVIQDIELPFLWNWSKFFKSLHRHLKNLASTSFAKLESPTVQYGPHAYVTTAWPKFSR